MINARVDMGQINHKSHVYGYSVEKIPLTVWLPVNMSPDILIMAGIHGDEAETTVVLSEALRSVSGHGLVCGVILCGNPDGILRGTRANARGVDLNRNMPTKNWSPQPVFYKSLEGVPRDIRLSPGEEPGSEPENQALIQLINEMNPKAVISMHAALACLEDPSVSQLGKVLAERTGLPLVDDIGYPTPGSMGSWAAEKGLNLITYELEAASAYDQKRRHVPVLVDLLTGIIKI